MALDLTSLPRVGAIVARRPARAAAAAMLAVTAVWGTTFVVVQAGISRMPVAPILMWRFLAAAALLLLLRPRSVAAMPAALRRRGALAGAVLGTGYLLQTVGLRTTSAAVSAFITGMFVVFVPLVAAVALRQRVGRTAWVAVGLAAVGLGFLALHGWALGPGEVLTLVGALVYAVHLVLLGRWTAAEHAHGLTIVQLATVAVLCAALAPFSGGPLVPPDRATWGAILFMAVFATALAFGAQTWAQSHLSPTRTAVIMTTEPVWAGAVGVLVAGDPITPRLVIGGSLVLAAMYLVELAPHRPGQPDEAALPHLEP